MSADNWAICPECKAKVDALQEERRAKAEKAYGKVPAEQYLAMLENIGDCELPIDLREDYEIWMGEDGKFTVHYSATCVTCGWSFNFEHSEQAK